VEHWSESVDACMVLGPALQVKIYPSHTNILTSRTLPYVCPTLYLTQRRKKHISGTAAPCHSVMSSAVLHNVRNKDSPSNNVVETAENETYSSVKFNT
jgi:hypothetical protein